MRFSNASTYALRPLAQLTLHKPNGYLRSRHIVSAVGVPEP
jgi:hypothetical protein